jgi:hypothetical protein
MGIVDALLMSYGLTPPKSQVNVKSRDLGADVVSDSELTTSSLTTDEEQRFLSLPQHAKIMRIGATDRAKQRGSALLSMYRALNTWMKILFWVVAFLVIVCMLPTVGFMAVKVLGNKLIWAKLGLLVFFAALVFMSHLMIVKTS